MKIQDGALVTSCDVTADDDTRNRFVARHLISGIGFTSIPSVLFRKWRRGV